MRYLSKTLSAVVVGLVVLSSAPADGPDVGAAIDKVVAARTAEAAAKSLTAKAEAEFRELWVTLQKRVDDLKLTGPVVPPVIPPVIPPADPLTVRLKAAYLADTGDPAKRPAALADLVELMHQAQALTDDPAVTTVAGLAGKVSTAAKTLAKDQLIGVWAILKAELAAAFPADAALTVDSRAAAKVLFTRLENSLKEAGK